MFRVYIKRYKTPGGKERFSFYSETTGKILTVGVKFLPDCFIYTGDSFYTLDRKAMEEISIANFLESRYWAFYGNYRLFKDSNIFNGLRYSQVKERQRL